MGSEILFDGSREILDSKWSYWDGPRLIAKPPIKWKIVKDPVDVGTVLNTFDSVALGGKYGTADIVTNRKFKDFRLHIEFLIKNKGGNSGVYLQNRYEIQIKDGDSTIQITSPDGGYVDFNFTETWGSDSFKSEAIAAQKVGNEYK